MSNNDLNVSHTNNQTSNLEVILAGFDGSMAMIGTIGGKKFSAVFNIVNGVVSETIEYGDSDMNQEDLEKALVGLEAGLIFGGIAGNIALGAAVILGISSAPLVIIFAGATAIATTIYDDEIYGLYTNLQTKVFDYFTSNQLSPVQSSSEIASIEYYQDGFGTIKRYDDNMDITATMTYEQLIDSTVFDKIDDNNSSWDIVETNTSEQIAYNKNTLEAIVNTSTPITSQSTPKALEYILKETEANQITINNHTADVATPTNLQLRNALTSIDDYQFLLSDILIKPGERLDMGSAGIITVSSGDTLSALAYKYLGGNAVDATRSAVFLNPWLADDGRIKFSANIDKVLIKDGASLGNNDTEHFYLNQTSADFFYDANGGFDHYYVGDLDIIKDSDGSGEVYFDGRLLSGTKIEVSGSNGYQYEDGNYTYSLQNPNGTGTLTITEGTQDKGFSGKYMTVEDFSSGDLGIIFSDASNDKDITINITDPTVTEGDDGIKLMTFTISASRDLTGTESVTLNLNIEDFGTDSSDYGSLSTSSITLNATSKTQTVTLEIIGDTKVEEDEDLWLNADVASKTELDEVIVIPGLGTIVNDDGNDDDDDDDDDDNLVQVKISDATLNESDAQMIFTISLIGTLNQGDSLRVNLETFDISATGGKDYGGVSGYVEFNASTQTQTFGVSIREDEYKEGDETFYLSPTGIDYNGTKQVLLENAGTGTIIDDDDDTRATPYDDVLILTDEDDVMDGLAGDDYIEGKAGNDILSGNLGNDILWGGSGNDMLYGDEGNDILFGDSGNDYLEGGSGDDTLYGGDGNDVLLGGEGSDYLNGGDGFDYYIANGGDVVEDSDGSGAVFFNNSDLTGRKKLQQGSSDVYEDGNNTYVESGGGLVITSSNGESITIAGWSNKELGIELVDNGDIEVSVGDESAFEAAEVMHVNVGLQRKLLNDEQVEVELGYYTNTYRREAYGSPVSVAATPQRRSYDDYTGTWRVSPARAAYTYQPTRQIVTGQVFNSVGSVTFQGGEQYKVFTYEWTDNDYIGINSPYSNPLTLTPRTKEDNSTYSSSIDVIVKKSGSATIIDDDQRGRIDPLVLDTNKDGFISTTSLDDSNTYFDITGDGLRERVGWVSPEDALLVFGSVNESGFDELRRVVDSNYDNIIDRKDELFQKLQVWNDYNQDAKVDIADIPDFTITSPQKSIKYLKIMNSLDFNKKEVA